VSPGVELHELHELNKLNGLKKLNEVNEIRTGNGLEIRNPKQEGNLTRV